MRFRKVALIPRNESNVAFSFFHPTDSFTCFVCLFDSVSNSPFRQP